MTCCFPRRCVGVLFAVIALITVYQSFVLYHPKVTSMQAVERMESMPIKCREKREIAFLKVHKAGSTTIMNILQRFGEKRQLICAIPKGGNYLGYGTTIDEGYLVPPPPNKTYQLLYNHVVYNHQVFHRVMPNGTFYVAIVREPLDLLESAIRYLQKRYKYIAQIPEEKLPNFLANPTLYKPEHRKDDFTDNRIAFDFGLSGRDVRNTTAIREHLLRMDEDFDLVMILEYMDESLVLLKRMLCWSLRDIIYIPANINNSRKKRPFSKEIQNNFKNWAKADIAFYDHFYMKFWGKIVDQGEDFFQELRVFKKLLHMVSSFCQTRKDSFQREEKLTLPKTDFSEEFTVNFGDCSFMQMPELKFMDITLNRHLRFLKKKS